MRALALLITLFAATSGAQSVVCGDCDLSGGSLVTILDALAAAQHAVGILSAAPCVCDVDLSGSVTVLDALLIAQVAAGLPTPLACGHASAPAIPQGVMNPPCGQIGTPFLVEWDHQACNVGYVITCRRAATSGCPAATIDVPPGSFAPGATRASTMFLINGGSFECDAVACSGSCCSQTTYEIVVEAYLEPTPGTRTYSAPSTPAGPACSGLGHIEMCQ